LHVVVDVKKTLWAQLLVGLSMDRGPLAVDADRWLQAAIAKFEHFILDLSNVIDGLMVRDKEVCPSFLC
jgi:hypothetical protein